MHVNNVLPLAVRRIVNSDVIYFSHTGEIYNQKSDNINPFHVPVQLSGYLSPDVSGSGGEKIGRFLGLIIPIREMYLTTSYRKELQGHVKACGAIGSRSEADLYRFSKI